jgi:PAS domain S-box-containing protein
MLVLAFERKNTEELLRQSEEQYRNLFEKSSDVVFISTPEGRFIDINPAGIKLFGFSSKEEVLNINIADDLYADPDERERFRTIIDRDGQIKEFEFKLKTKDGNEIIAIETTTVLCDDSGNVVAYQGIIRDITKKRKLENQLFQSQKMDSIGMLAGGIAHDFNNILTALRGYTDMALMKISQDAPEENEIKGISRGIERAEDLTRQLLAFGRKQIIESKVIDINQVILNLEKMLARLIGEDINLKTILAEDIGQVKADPGQIEQILVNLIINARDAINQKDSHTTDKKITIETKQVYLDFGYVVNHPEVMVGDYFMIAVSDTGCGMDDNQISKIYEPFYTTKSPGKGTGLGLSTVYGIVKQNQGNIYVYSEINKGSTFKIYWPMTEQELVSDYAEVREEALIYGEESILFVEDDEEVRKFICQALKSLNYDIIEASNGLDALEIVKKNNIKLDLLITDVIMPEMGGKELAEEIVKFVPGIKILFTSGYTDNHIVRSGRLDEGINFLLKPFSIKDISKKIRVILEN